MTSLQVQKSPPQPLPEATRGDRELSFLERADHGQVEVAPDGRVHHTNIDGADTATFRQSNAGRTRPTRIRTKHDERP